jgi:hypothetical protein
MTEAQNTETESTELELEEEIPQQPAATEDLSADFADRVFERVTTTGAAALTGKGELIKRRRVSFMLDGASCSPDVYCDEDGNYLDFRVTVQSLNSREEVEAIQGVTDAGQVPFMLAKASLCRINGKPIAADRKDFHWEAFGQGGRQLVLLAFQQVGSASGIALGKFQASISVD